MSGWTNRVAYSVPRDGTDTTTVDPSSTANVVSGTPFTPTAGRLLVVSIEGAVTSQPPAGWTEPPGGSAVNNSGLYVWYLPSAAGGDTFTTPQHNGTNYPVAVEVWEFENGSTFLGAVAASNVPADGSYGSPVLSGLSGTNTLIALGGQANASGYTGSVSWSDGVVQTQICVLAAATDGYVYSSAALIDSALGSWAPQAVFSLPNPSVERIVFAVHATSAASTSAQVQVPAASVAVAAPAPAVSSSSSVAVSTAAVTVSAPAPAVTVTNPPPAVASPFGGATAVLLGTQPVTKVYLGAAVVYPV